MDEKKPCSARQVVHHRVVHDDGAARLVQLDARVVPAGLRPDHVVADDPVEVPDGASRRGRGRPAYARSPPSPRPNPMPRAQSTITLFSTSVSREPTQKWIACSARPAPVAVDALEAVARARPSLAAAVHVDAAGVAAARVRLDVRAPASVIRRNVEHSTTPSSTQSVWLRRSSPSRTARRRRSKWRP